MSRVSEIVVAVEASGVDATLNALKQVNSAQVQGMKTTQEMGGTTERTLRSALGMWGDLSLAINQTAEVVRKVIQGVEMVWNFSYAGAQLDYLSTRFDNLSGSIHESSYFLLKDLREVTGGILSESEMMQSAADFIGLGFAKSSEEAVRLANVSSALNMNMNQLVLTLANMTTMRFDQLGLRVEGFKEKVEELEEAGYDAAAAFKEAFLLQGEQAIATAGSVVDTTLGEYRRLESNVKTIFDRMRSDMATFWEPTIRGVNNLLDTAVSGGGRMDLMTEALRVLGETYASEFPFMKMASEGLNEEIDEMAAHVITLQESFGDGIFTSQKTQAIVAYYQSLDKVEQEFITLVPAIGGAGDQLTWFGDTTEETAELIDNFLEKAGIFASDFNEIFDLGSVFSDQTKDVNGLISELTVLGVEYGRLKTQLEDQLISAQLDLNVAIRTFKESVADDLVAGLKEAGLKGDELYETLLLVDQAFGTSKALEFKLEVDTQELVDMLADPATRALFTGEAAKFIETNIKINADVMQAQMDIRAVYIELANLRKEVEIKAKAIIDDTALTTYVAPDDKTMAVVAEVDSSFVDAWNPPTKYGKVVYLPSGSVPQDGRAIGGVVYPGQSYVWQEPNREGELLIPEQYGRVLSNSEVSQVISDALTLAPVNNAPAPAPAPVNNGGNITYNINAMYEPEPALTLSEHLRILNYLGRRAR